VVARGAYSLAKDQFESNVGFFGEKEKEWRHREEDSSFFQNRD
jgi:hypothetical protein